MIQKHCEICKEEFTQEEIDSLDTDVHGLHGQHVSDRCKTFVTEKDADCDCWPDGDIHPAHPGCCLACKTHDFIFSDWVWPGDDAELEDGPPTGTVFQGPWSTS